MENTDILFLRKNKAFIKIKAVERATGINDSVLVKSVDGKMNLPQKWEKSLSDWVKKFISGYNKPKEPALPVVKDPKPKAAVKQNKAKKEPVKKNAEVVVQETPDAKARIAELENELKNPPKNPAIGLKLWKKLRQDELKKLIA